MKTAFSYCERAPGIRDQDERLKTEGVEKRLAKRKKQTTGSRECVRRVTINESRTTMQGFSNRKQETGNLNDE